MAEETDLSRTEPASPRRLQEARSAGDVPRSAELTAWVVLLSALGMLGWQAPRLLEALQALISAAFIHAAQPLSPVFVDAAHAALWAVLPVLAASFAAALVTPMLLSGWVFAPHVTQMDLRRASPFKPFSRLLSQDALFDALAMLLKLLLGATAVWWVLASGWNAPFAADSRTALDAFAGWVGRGVLAVAAALTLAAALDAGWRWWRYLRRHAMTWQEVLAEAREAEVHPEIRAQLRGRQQQAGQRPLPLSPKGGNPLPEGEHPAGPKGTNVTPKTINEVIG